MKWKQLFEEQKLGIPKKTEEGAVVTDLCRRHGMSCANLRPFWRCQIHAGGWTLSIIRWQPVAGSASSTGTVRATAP